MPSGNGARAKQKRERNAEKKKDLTAAHSQLKQNAQCMTIVCKQCRQPFMCVASVSELRQHAENRHPKVDYSQCFDKKE